MSLDTIVSLIVAIIILVTLSLIWNAFWLWWQSILSNAPVGLFQIIFMNFVSVSIDFIVVKLEFDLFVKGFEFIII